MCNKVQLLGLCFVWFSCYVQVVNTNFISDKMLRSSASCQTDCESDFNCPLHSICYGGSCMCDRGLTFSENCTECITCKNFQNINNNCVSECCSGYCMNNVCVTMSSNQDILLTATQIAMTGALILGIITIIALLWKMCSKTDYRRRPATNNPGRSTGRHSGDSTTSGGSLQRAVAARLRDAPPPYVRTSPLPPPGDTPPPYHLLSSQGYVNVSFEGEGNIPPPDYSIAIRTTNNDTENNTNGNINNDASECQENKVESDRDQTAEKENKAVPETVPVGSSLHI